MWDLGKRCRVVGRIREAGLPEQRFEPVRRLLWQHDVVGVRLG